MYKILIVDDDRNYRWAIREIIDWASLGFIIEDEAINGSQALKKLENKEYDLVITDMSMPLMNGTELIREAHKRKPDLLFVALSAYDEFDFVREALREGAVDYILKYEMQEDTIHDIMLKIREKLDVRRSEENQKYITAMEDIQNLEIRKAIIYLTENYKENITLQEIADYVGLSKNYFSNLFKEETGETFVKFQNKLKVYEAKELLEHTGLKTYEVAERVGYKNPSYFSKIFKEITGVTVDEYKKNL